MSNKNEDEGYVIVILLGGFSILGILALVFSLFSERVQGTILMVICIIFGVVALGVPLLMLIAGLIGMGLNHKDKKKEIKKAEKEAAKEWRDSPRTIKDTIARESWSDTTKRAT